jgi:predicted nucleotidyltransferase component of viral defense system
MIPRANIISWRSQAPWLGKPKWKQNQGRVTLIYRFQSEIPPIQPLRLKIEINTREHFTVLGLVRVLFPLSNPWYNGESEAVTYPVEELLGTKMRALYQRKKGRDLFDLATAIAHIPHLDLDKIVHCFEVYMSKDDARVSRAEFESNLIHKLNDEQFIKDLRPLLTLQSTVGNVEGYDITHAGREVLQLLAPKLAGEAWKGTKST